MAMIFVDLNLRLLSYWHYFLLPKISEMS